MVVLARRERAGKGDGEGRAHVREKKIRSGRITERRRMVSIFGGGISEHGVAAKQKAVMLAE